jgi:hypothetical protein
VFAQHGNAFMFRKIFGGETQRRKAVLPAHGSRLWRMSIPDEMADGVTVQVALKVFML